MGAASGATGDCGRGPAHRLVACHHCDTLQRLPPAPPGNSFRCRVCDTRLAVGALWEVDRALAIALVAVLLWVLANTLPLIELLVEGRRGMATLAGTAAALWDSGRWLAAAMVLATSVLFPGALVLGLAYGALAARLGRRLPGVRSALRLVAALEPWGMLDVFLLAILVAAVKLADLAQVAVGPGLVAFVALVLTVVSLSASFDPRCLWERLPP